MHGVGLSSYEFISRKIRLYLLVDDGPSLASRKKEIQVTG